MRKALIGAASVLTAALGGCGWLSGTAVDAAIAVCVPHGGVKALHPLKLDTSPSYEVDCADGVTITGRAKDAP